MSHSRYLKVKYLTFNGFGSVSMGRMVYRRNLVSSVELHISMSQRTLNTNVWATSAIHSTMCVCTRERSFTKTHICTHVPALANTHTGFPSVPIEWEFPDFRVFELKIMSKFYWLMLLHYCLESICHVNEWRTVN